MTPVARVTLEAVGSQPVANPEPSPAELAQCEAEVGTLLSIIAELNKKMGTLKAPSEPEDFHLPDPYTSPGPDPVTLGLVRCSPERKTAADTTSKLPVTNRGGSGEVWSKLQEVLSAVEDSISFRRSWAVPVTVSDHGKQREHLAAAQQSWVQASQILAEIEREFGISCPSALPTEERYKYQRDIMGLQKRNCALRTTLKSCQEELNGAKDALNHTEEERHKLQEMLVDAEKAWRSCSPSPPYSTKGTASGGAVRPDWSSPPFPSSPLLFRKPKTPSDRDVSPLASPGSERASLGSCCPSPFVSTGSETERLQRCMEKLKARNERLTAALEHRKGELEQISLTLSRHEADRSALQMALRYCEECEEAYSQLLLLYEAKNQQGIPVWTDSAEQVNDRQQHGSPKSWHRSPGTEELSTSFSTADGAEETETHSHTRHGESDLEERETALHQQIERLKRDRAAICIPKPGPGGKGKLSPDPATLNGGGAGHGAKDTPNPSDIQKEKAALLHKLITVKEEMSELRGLIRLTEREWRYLDRSLMAQKAKDAAGALISESLREEQEERKTAQQKLAEDVVKMASEGDIPGPRSITILRELRAILQREQALKRRLSAVHDALETALSDSASCKSDEYMVQLAKVHGKSRVSDHDARRKYREHGWRLEQKWTAMSENHQSQIGALRATVEASERSQEETVL
ncbi:uncharacterized protein ushbp1 isoform X2 [Lampris incognitus]|nr:uncharacterized protein ushbp1 isoform X2 [Lampris incognitus]